MKYRLHIVSLLCLVVLMATGCGIQTKQIEFLNQRIESLNQTLESRDQQMALLIQKVEFQGQQIEFLNQRMESLNGRMEFRTKQQLSDPKVSAGDRPAIQAGGKININTATQEQLITLHGIGKVLSGRIIEGRPYKRVDDLLRIKGIGKKNLEKIRDEIVVE